MAELNTSVSTETAEKVTTEMQAATAEIKEAEPNNDGAELARLKAEMAKLKAANDKLSKENGEKTKALRAKQTAEETAAEEAKAQQEALMQELETLRKERAVAATTAKVMSLVNDGTIAAQVAEYLYGAEDVDAAVTAIQKAWTAKEKALRLEYGKIPAPGAGESDGPAMTKEEILKIKDPVARQNAIAQNIKLFTKG